jgi:large subunit ribosomal protein L13
MKSYAAKREEVVRDWIHVDAAGKTLGRLAVEIGNVLRGRNKPTYTPHVDTGDFVIVTNAEKVKLTGNKEEKKIYQTYSGYRSGQKEMTAAELRKRHPDQMIFLAVRGMLPKNTLCKKAIKRLKIYTGEEHPHDAQNPKTIELV